MFTVKVILFLSFSVLCQLQNCVWSQCYSVLFYIALNKIITKHGMDGNQTGTDRCQSRPLTGEAPPPRLTTLTEMCFFLYCKYEVHVLFIITASQKIVITPLNCRNISVQMFLRFSRFSVITLYSLVLWVMCSIVSKKRIKDTANIHTCIVLLLLCCFFIIITVMSMSVYKLV